jgi:hypothetical protein
MYSREDFENNMPEYAVPPVLTINCNGFYLSLVASGQNPAEINLIDNPKDRMDAARDDLVKLNAIALDTSPNGMPQITDLGKVSRSSRSAVFSACMCVVLMKSADVAKILLDHFALVGYVCFVSR